MYIFKTSGKTFDSVIRNQKHAFNSKPVNIQVGDLILVSKKKADCAPDEKEISFTMRLKSIRETTDEEITKYWPGFEGKWKYIFDCYDTEAVPEPFNLDDVLSNEDLGYYIGLQTFRPIKPEHEKAILPFLTVRSVNSTDEISTPQHYKQGACKSVMVNAYERDPAARSACIEHYGLSCQACGFNFQEQYGQLGEGFIHVHHIVPLADIGEEYIVDPRIDLIPLCPNCHAMIHRRKPALTIEELRQLLMKDKK